MTDASSENARQAALDYHEFPRPGKLEIRATKPMANQRDLARAYSPGVAEACLEIKADPVDGGALHRARQSGRGGVERHGRAGPRQHRRAGLEAGDGGQGGPVQEVRQHRLLRHRGEREAIRCKLAEIVAALEPTFGAINLEDIKAPDCFIVERLCRERMKIPVFHDDQHGTAIVVGAAAINALRVAKKRIEDVKIVSTGGGAAGHRLPQHAAQARREAREHLALRPARPRATSAAPRT